MKKKTIGRISISVLLFFVIASTAYGQTNTASAGATWEAATWSLGHVPTAAENAVINSGVNLTINSAAVCGSLTIGNATATATTLTINGNNSLTISGTTGNLSINPNNVFSNMTLAVNAGTLTVAGTPTMSATNTQSINITTGSALFTRAAGFTLASGRISLSAAGSVTFTGLITQTGGTLRNITTAGTFNFNSGFTKSGGAFNTLAGEMINFGGNLTVSGIALTFNATSTANFTATATITPTAAITFGNLTSSAGTQTLGGNITVAGNWTNNSGFNVNTRTVTFSGAAKTISGTSSTTFGPIIIASGSTRTMNNDNSCTGLTFTAAGTSNSFTHGGTSLLTVNGNVLINQPTANNRTESWNINGGSATVSGTTTVGSATSNTASRISRIVVTSGTLTLNGNTTLSTGTSSACALITLSTGIINFNAALNHTEGTITFSGTGTINFNSTYAFGPTASAAPALNTVAGANLNFANNFTASVALTLNAASNSTFTGNSNITPTANIVFGNLTVNTGVTATTANAGGSLSIAGNTLVGSTGNLGGAGTEPVLFTGAGRTIDGTGTIAATSTISGAQTILTSANLTISGTMTINTGITVTNNGIVNSTAAGGIVAGGGTATWTNGASSSLSVTGPLVAAGILNASNSGNLVNYSGAAQAVKLPSGTPAAYFNLTLSGSAVKTMPATAMTIGGDFIMSGTATATAAQALTVNGNFNLTAAGNTFSAGSFSHTIGANWTNAGTFTGNTSTVTLSGTGAGISGTGTYNIYNLIITGSGVNAAAATNLNIAGDFSTSGSGTFNHPSNGTVTMSGAAKTISGSGIVLNNFSATGSISTTTSLTLTGNFSANGTGSFSATAGTLTLSGASKTITNSGSGTLQFNAVTVSGTVSSTAGFSVSSDLSIVGTLTASAGTVTFNGTSILSGTANLFNVTLNGTSLQLGTNSILGAAGAFTLTAGTFNVTTTSPNTVTFNGGGAQTIPSTTYHNLQTATGGTKTAGGAVTVNGSFTIGSGSTFNASTYTHTIYGDWSNGGTFTSGTSTIIFTGSIDAAITGATTFSSMTINKSTSANLVTLNNNISVSTLNMTSGELHTGTNSVTITSTRTGSGVILGTITRTHTFSAGISYEFESQYNTINFSTIGTVSSVTVRVVLTAPADFPFGGSTNREYTNSITGSGYTATMRLHYLDAGLNGNNEATMVLWHYNGSLWASQGKSANNTTNNWVELNGITDITNRWCLSDDQNVVRWNGSASSAWATAGNWTIAQGSPSMPPGANDVVSLGSAVFTNQPAITTPVSIKSLQFGSAQAVTLTLGGGSLSTSGNIDGVWAGNANHTIAVGAQTLNIGGDLILSDGTSNHTIGLTIGTGTTTVTGSLTESGGSNITFSNSGTLNIAADFIYTSGTFTANSSTVRYNGSGSQAVAGLTYNNLTIDKTAGTASISSAVTVNGTLTLSASANLSLGATLGVTGNIAVNSGTTLQANGSAINLAGNWINTGSFSAGTSTVTLNGTGGQTIDATTFNNLTINKSSGTASLNGNIIVSGDLSVSSGTLDVVNLTANRNPAGGTFTLSGGTILRLSGPNNFPANYSSYSLNSTSTVEYYGTGIQTISAFTYGNLTLTNGGANAKSLAAPTTCTGNLLINSGAALSGGTTSFDVQGNWTNNGSFNAGTGTITLSGTGRTLTGTTTFNNLTLTGTCTASSDIAVNALMNISGGTYAAGSTTTTFSGNFTNTGSFTSSGTVTFSGTSAQTITLNSGFTTTGTTNFNGTAAPSFNSVTSPTFTMLNINNSGGVSPSRAWNITGAFTVANGAAFNGGSAIHTFSGPFTNNGTVTSANGTLRFTPASPATITLNGTAFSSTGTGIVEFGGTGLLTILGASPAINTLTISNTNVSGVTLPAAWTIGSDLNISAGAILNGGNYNILLNGSFNNSGTFNGQTSTITMAGTGETISGAGTTFNNLLIAAGATITANSGFNISGNFTGNGSLDATGRNITFSGSTPSTIGGTVNPVTFDILSIAKTSAITTLAQNINGISLLSVSGGSFDISTYTVSEDAGAGTLQINANAAMRIDGTNGLPAFTTYDLDPASTVEYYSSAAQTITAATYGGLLLSGSGTKTIDASLTTDGDLTISTGTPLNISGGITLTVNGNWQDDGTFTAGTGTVQLGGAAKSITGATTFNNLTIDGNETNSGTIIVDGSLSGAGSLTQGAGSSLTINGTPVSLAVLNASASANTVLYAGTGAQSVLTTTYYDLTLSNTGIKTASSNFTVNRDLMISTGSNFTINPGVVIQVLGKVTTSGLLNNEGQLLISD